MKAAVITFPGSNCDRDMVMALEAVTGHKVKRVWHKDSDIGNVDLIAIPGGFSYGDYLRCGAMSAHSAIMTDVKKKAADGVMILGVCNGFQILTESGLLPGALMRNAGLSFICEDTALDVEHSDSAFTKGYVSGARITIPVAHHDGNYFADPETLDRLEGEGRVLFRYASDINGAQRRIAGITDKTGRILGMMPHPERAADPLVGLTDGTALFQSMLDSVN